MYKYVPSHHDDSGQKSAVKVYTDMYSVHASTVYTLSENFIQSADSEMYGYILSYTYNRISRHTRWAKSHLVYLSIYGDILLANRISQDILSISWDIRFP